jgi:hypothetical protein
MEHFTSGSLSGFLKTLNYEKPMSKIDGNQFDEMLLTGNFKRQRTDSNHLAIWASDGELYAPCNPNAHGRVMLPEVWLPTKAGLPCCSFSLTDQLIHQRELSNPPAWDDMRWLGCKTTIYHMKHFGVSLLTPERIQFAFYAAKKGKAA